TSSRAARLHRQGTIVQGAARYRAASADRLVTVLDPWGVKCQVVDVAVVNKPRPLSEEDAKTWVGLGFGKSKPGADNPVANTGFAVPGDVILLGSPEDNGLIKFLNDNKFLPYAPKTGAFPGAG